MAEKYFLTPKELAAYGDKSLSTIKRWIKSGKVEAFQPAGKHTSVLIPVFKLRLDMFPESFIKKICGKI